MIVLDASAIVAILNEEPGNEDLIERYAGERERRIAPTSALECIMVLSRKYREPQRDVEAFLRSENIVVDAIDDVRTGLAQFAFLTYGKGRHPARLNLGDCFSYAAAKALDAPLLFIGNDFSQTDVRVA